MTLDASPDASDAPLDDRYPEAPFPWFGGKSRAAELVWSRFGACRNYVEPFAGSLAVLLRRPAELMVPGGLETVNDLDCYVVNFWRSCALAPAEVARWADWPVAEADMLARHRWLLSRDDFRKRIFSDPNYCVPKIAGWWVYGQCAWIGWGWCHVGSDPGPQLPHLSAGRGVNRSTPDLPADFAAELAAAYLRPDGAAVDPTARRAFVGAWIEALQRRMRDVRIVNGEWHRVLSDSVTWRNGTTAILLDPPYAEGAMDYGPGGTGTGLSQAVREWCLKHGEDDKLRIALCGLEGEHPGLVRDGWDCVAWTARGGYGSQRRDASNVNRGRERIWFSPHCLGA